MAEAQRDGGSNDRALPLDDAGGAHALPGRPIALSIAVLVVTLLACLGGVWLLMRHWGLGGGSGPAAPVSIEVAAPALETAPQPALVRYRARKLKRLETFGWTDRSHRLVHIPIETAMRQLADEASADRAAAPRERSSARQGRPPPELSPQRNADRAAGQHDSAVRHAMPPEDAAPAPVPHTPRSSRHDGARLLDLLPIASADAAVPPPDVGFEQHLGAALPLAASFTDSSGRAVRLGEFFTRDPVVLVLGYYHCKRLCTGVMDGVIQALGEVDVPYRVVGVSVDPREDRALAASKQAAYARIARTPQAAPALLLGAEAQIAKLARTVGFDYRYDAASDEYAHAAGFVVATPDGRVSRYFFGLRFDVRDLRLALVEASRGRLGTLRDRLVLLCSHYDPATGRYSLAIMNVIRVIAALLVAGLALWMWRHRRSSGRAAS